MSAHDYPCRVSIETRDHLEKQAQNEMYAPEFDPWDDALMHDICGPKFAPIIQDLILRLESIQKTEASFGADRDKTFDFILPSLQKLRDVCEEEFRQL